MKNRVESTQRKARKMLYFKHSRMKFLQKSWDSFGLKLLVKAKPTAKEKEIAKKYKLISEEIRDQVLENYH
jgi:hypothetical protein